MVVLTVASEDLRQARLAVFKTIGPSLKQVLVRTRKNSLPSLRKPYKKSRMNPKKIISDMAKLKRAEIVRPCQKVWDCPHCIGPIGDIGDCYDEVIPDEPALRLHSDQEVYCDFSMYPDGWQILDPVWWNDPKKVKTKKLFG